jgi:hypothetical protein
MEVSGYLTNFYFENTFLRQMFGAKREERGD